MLGRMSENTWYKKYVLECHVGSVEVKFFFVPHLPSHFCRESRKKVFWVWLAVSTPACVLMSKIQESKGIV